MTIMWLVNRCPHFLEDMMSCYDSVSQGWLDYSGNRIAHEQQLIVVFPHGNELKSISTDLCKVILFPFKYSIQNTSQQLENIFLELLKKIKPEIIHIHGTEFSHSFAMLSAAERYGADGHCVVSIQGLSSKIAYHYYSGLPISTIYGTTIRDLFRTNICGDKKIFEKRGIIEENTIKKAQHVIGRTEWDKACVTLVNPNVHYWKCNETLRDAFYSGRWEYNECEKHSIFISQSSYPIKAVHMAIEAFSLIKNKYFDAKLFITGEDVFKIPFYRINSYQRYIKRIIQEKGLNKSVIFLGSLNESEMKIQFLKANVFVTPSSIENSPNSLGEAMILGVPAIAADVGGISSVFTHNIDGYLYPFNEPYMLAHYIDKIFVGIDNRIITNNAIEHARRTHCREKNYEDLLGIYKTILDDKY